MPRENLGLEGKLAFRYELVRQSKHRYQTLELAEQVAKGCLKNSAYQTLNTALPLTPTRVDPQLSLKESLIIQCICGVSHYVLPFGYFFFTMLCPARDRSFGYFLIRSLAWSLDRCLSTLTAPLCYCSIVRLLEFLQVARWVDRKTIVVFMGARYPWPIISNRRYARGRGTCRPCKASSTTGMSVTTSYKLRLSRLSRDIDNARWTAQEPFSLFSTYFHFILGTITDFIWSYIMRLGISMLFGTR